MFISPDAMCCGARCSHAVALYVMLLWWDGYPFSVHIADAMAMELSLHVYSLFIYSVIGVCHPEKGSAVNLMNPKDLCTVGELLAQDCSRRRMRGSS